MCKRLGMHNIQCRQNLLGDIFGFRFRYSPRALHDILFEITEGHVLHSQKDIWSIFEPAKEVHKYSSFSELSNRD